MVAVVTDNRIDPDQMLFLKEQMKYAESSLKCARRDHDQVELEDALAWVADCANSIRLGTLSPTLAETYRKSGGSQLTCPGYA